VLGKALSVFWRGAYLALKKDSVIVILILVVVLGVVCNKYDSNQLNAHPNSTFQPTPQSVPTSALESNLTPLPESDPPSDSQITIQSSTPSDSGQPVSDLRLGVYIDDPSKSQLKP